MGMSVRLYREENCVGCFYVTKGVIDILSDARLYSLICDPKSIDIVWAGEMVIPLKRAQERLGKWAAVRRTSAYYALRYFCERYRNACIRYPTARMEVAKWG